MSIPSRIGDPAIYSSLAALGIEFGYYTHPPVPTIAAAMVHWRSIPAWHCKNLFLRNHKGDQHFLILIEGSRRADIRALEAMLRQGKLSFASPRRMMRYLGVEPGSVSPFGLVHDREHHVRVFVDSTLQHADRIAFHPNDNRASLVISGADFAHFLDAMSNPWEFLDLAARPGA